MAARWIRSVGRAVIDPRVRRNRLHEWGRRWGGEPSLPATPIRHVLVICKGNICRSPFAHALLAQRAPSLCVRSAGLETGGDAAAEPGAQRAARDFGLDLARHRSAAFGAAEVAWADLILAMESAQLVALARRHPEARSKARLLGDFLERGPYTIEDPWGCDDAVFRATFGQIGDAVDRLVARLGAAA